MSAVDLRCKRTRRARQTDALHRRSGRHAPAATDSASALGHVGATVASGQPTAAVDDQRLSAAEAVGGELAMPGRRSPPPTADVALALAPVTTRVNAEGHGADTHGHPPRRHRCAEAHAVLDRPIESMLASVRHTQRNVKRWRDCDMPALDRRRDGRSPAQLPPRQGHRDLPKLTAAIRRELDPTPTKEASPSSSPPETIHIRTATDDLQRPGQPPREARLMLHMLRQCARLGCCSC